MTDQSESHWASILSSLLATEHASLLVDWQSVWLILRLFWPSIKSGFIFLKHNSMFYTIYVNNDQPKNKG